MRNLLIVGRGKAVDNEQIPPFGRNDNERPMGGNLS